MAKQYEILKHEMDVLLHRINSDGTETAVLDRPIEAEVVVLAFEEGEERTVVSKGRNRYNQALHSEKDPGQAALNLTLLEFPPDIKALLFAGELTITQEPGASIVDEAVTAPAVGHIVKLAHGQIAAAPAPVVTSADGLTTYVVDTDYVIERDFGILRIPEGSSIAAGTGLLASYTYTAVEVISIAGGVKPEQAFRVQGFMRNRPTNRDAYFEAYNVPLSRSGETDLLGAEALQIELAGTMTVPAGKSAPYEYIERNPGA